MHVRNFLKASWIDQLMSSFPDWQGASSGSFLKDSQGRQIRLPRYSCWNEQGELDPDVRRSLPPDYPPRPPIFSAPHHIWILCSALTSRPKRTYWLHGNEPNCRLLEFDGDRILRCFLLGRALERFPGAESAEIWVYTIRFLSSGSATILLTTSV